MALSMKAHHGHPEARGATIPEAAAAECAKRLRAQDIDRYLATLFAPARNRSSFSITSPCRKTTRR
jgi:hypothetical protein